MGMNNVYPIMSIGLLIYIDYEEEREPEYPELVNAYRLIRDAAKADLTN